MKILTTQKQKEIEENRNIIYDYITSCPKKEKENAMQAMQAIEALCTISCACGVWSLPFDLNDIFERMGK